MEQATKTQKENYNKYLIGKNCYDTFVSRNDGKYVICAIGIGDTITTASLMDSYKKQNQVERIILVVQESHRWIASCFPGVDDTYVVTKQEIECLQAFMYMTAFYDSAHVLYAHYRLNRRLMKGETGEVYRITDMSLSFVNSYKHDILQISMGSTPSIPVIETVKDIITEYDGAVLLAPYAVTFRMLPMSFWEKLAKAYDERGIKVYTNVREGEEPIIGTQALQLSLKELLFVSDRFCRVIALRSGLCDALIYASCPLDVLYPYDKTTAEDGCTMDQQDIICDLRELNNREGLRNLICHAENEDRLVTMLVSR